MGSTPMTVLRDRLAPVALRYSIAPSVSRAIRARAVICLFRASVSAERAPCFRAFLWPLGGPPTAPTQPAVACHCSPLQFDLAWHLDA
jgi:hypothetical protein